MRISKRQLRKIIREEADMVSAALSSDPVDKLIAYIQTLTPDDEIGLSEVGEMLRNQGHSAEKIDSIVEDPRLDQYYDALEDIFAPGRVQNENRMKVTKRQLRKIIAEVIEDSPALNEADMTNDPRVQELIKKAEFEVSRGRLFPGDVKAIKDMARGGYSAAEIKRIKRLRF